MNRFIISLLGLVLALNLCAQNFELDYVPVKNTKPVPKDLLISSSLKYKSKKKTITRKSKNKRKKKSENSFHLTNSFVIDELLNSGRVNFSDPITLYINKVADELLKNEKRLRKKLQFYTIKSAVPNAFATDRGIIFVNLGLLAKLESEAELAFILSHEISHYVKKHNLKSKITFDEIQRNKRKLKFRRSGNKYDALLEQSNYSKKLEIEADKLGMKRFLKSEWDFHAMEGTFNVLEYAHTPFIESEIKSDFLNLEHLILPEKYFLKEVDEIVALSDDEDDYDDENEDENENENHENYSTHPGLEERREKAIAAIKKAQPEGKKKFVVSQKDFELSQKMAQFEICNILIQNQGYISGIYHNYALLQEYPKNKFLKRNLVYALYGIAQYSNAERYDIIPSESEIQGEIQQIYHLFNKLSTTDINVIAVRHLWDYSKEHPKDKAIQLMIKDMVEDMVIYQIENPKSYFKPSKKKMKKAKYFARNAMVDLMKDKKFKKMLKDGKKYRKKFEANRDNPTKHKSYALGVKKVLFLDPKYVNINDDGLDYLASEKKQNEFRKIIKNTSKIAKLKATVLDTKSLSSRSKIKDFNDIILLRNWADELMNHNMYMINSNYNEVQPLIKKYKTQNVVLSGNVTLSEKPKIRRMITWKLIPPLTPLAYSNFMKQHAGFVYTFVLDLKVNEIRMKEVTTYRQKDNADIVGMNLYAAMIQIKKKKKKKK